MHLGLTEERRPHRSRRRGPWQPPLPAPLALSVRPRRSRPRCWPCRGRWSSAASSWRPRPPARRRPCGPPHGPVSRECPRRPCKSLTLAAHRRLGEAELAPLQRLVAELPMLQQGLLPNRQPVSTASRDLPGDQSTTPVLRRQTLGESAGRPRRSSLSTPTAMPWRWRVPCWTRMPSTHRARRPIGIKPIFGRRCGTCIGGLGKMALDLLGTWRFGRRSRRRWAALRQTKRGVCVVGWSHIAAEMFQLRCRRPDQGAQLFRPAPLPAQRAQNHALEVLAVPGLPNLIRDRARGARPHLWRHLGAP
mmetsp:Transcript_51671/g.166238  ORF Transcript_51671/g.166238 Transcript_51671/m.166238 type:complete len:305 (-) Transcript_51671:137-1051(-)